MKSSALFVTVAPIAPIAGIVYLGAPVGAWGAIHLVGLVLLSAALLLLTIARLQLGDAFSVAPEATMLVTHGLYARIRNPVYVFGSLLFAGLLLYLGKPWFLFCLLPVMALQVVRAGREAKVLEARFGDAYRAYRARTWF